MGIISTVRKWLQSKPSPVIEATKQPESNKKMIETGSIPKEEVAALPLDAYEGEVIVVDQNSDIRPALARLSKERVIGFDTETRPSFKKGVSNKISLLQLSTPNLCVLFRLHLLTDLSEIDQFMSKSAPIKIGVAIRDDIRGLGRLGITPSKSYIDLQTLAKDYGIEDNSLQRMYAILFGKKLSKRQRLSNWEAETLKPEQIKYAATDAWASLRIYQTLLDNYVKQEKKI